MRILKWQKGSARRVTDQLASEEPLEIQVDTRPVSVTMRTPGHDEELVAGFLLTEGLVSRREDLRELRHYPRNECGNVLNAFLAPGAEVDFARLTRHVFMSSSCGLCGKSTIAAVHRHFPRVRSRFRVAPETLLSLPGKMRESQTTFAATGGLHAAALFTAKGEIVVLREDVGRHNAVDKTLGFAVLHDLLPLDSHVLLVSGRASFEIVQKALAGRIAVVCAVSAPSSLAVEFARASGQTLIGFLRDGRFNIYAGGARVRGAS